MALFTCVSVENAQSGVFNVVNLYETTHFTYDLQIFFQIVRQYKIISCLMVPTTAQNRARPRLITGMERISKTATSGD